DGGVIRLILDEDTQYSLSFLATDTMQDIMDTLASYGIGTTIAANGSVALRNDDHTFTLGGALGSWLVQGGTYTNKETGYISDPLGYETTEHIDTNTKLSQLGVAPGSLNIVHDGLLEPNSIQIDEETTLGQLMNALKVYDVASSILTDAAGNTRIQLYATGDTVLQDGTCDAVSKLGLEVIKQGDYDSHIEYWDTGVASGLLTEDTLLTSLDKGGKTSVGSLIFELGTGADAVQHIVNISAEDTIGSFLEKMSNEGVHAVLDNGIIKLDNSVQGITFTGGTSEIFDTLGIAQGAIDTYSTSSAALTYEKDITYSVANFADKDTLLSTVNVTDGKMSIFVDGIKCEVNINSTDKFSDVFSKISSAVSAATGNAVTVNAGFLDKDGNIMINTAFDAAKNTGIIGIEVVGDHKLVIGASNDTTNFATIANLQQESSTRVAGSRALYKVNVNSLVTGSGLFKDGNITTGDFKIGDAVITIDSTTTLNDLINQINKSDKSYASAYWDTLSGTLVIQSTLTGESLINIESGSSNFTDIMGFTEKVAGKETLVTDLQTLGQNAQVRINGTLVTATSNTITSDVSKIKGLTINLKGLSEGEATTITVEQDDEGIYNAVSDIVDAYNTLMEGLEKELAEDGSFAHNAMFKMMKNNLKNLMTRSISGSPLYKNLAAVGISTGEAQDSISTDVTALIIDKDKFMEALDKNSDAVKQLIVGTQANKGVFLQAINIVDSTLKSTGYISSTEKTITKDITKLGKKISSLTEQLAHYREQLEKKFSSMERVISGLQTSYSGLLGA
ncbi:MAG: flagellar filament capping protein FliD, partial [Candidatus Gastranaerophilaceae bacterium]